MEKNKGIDLLKAMLIIAQDCGLTKLEEAYCHASYHYSSFINGSDWDTIQAPFDLINDECESRAWLKNNKFYPITIEQCLEEIGHE